MSLLRHAISAPGRATKATSAPSTASHAAMFAPEPPPCMVTVAGVSLLLASGNIAWATVSVIRSPMTTTRVNADHHLDYKRRPRGRRVIRGWPIELNSFEALPRHV